jgi:transposase
VDRGYLVETAKLNGPDAEAYLRDVLGRIAEHPVTRIGELVPWRIDVVAGERAAA